VYPNGYAIHHIQQSVVAASAAIALASAIAVALVAVASVRFMAFTVNWAMAVRRAFNAIITVAMGLRAGAVAVAITCQHSVRWSKVGRKYHRGENPNQLKVSHRLPCSISSSIWIMPSPSIKAMTLSAELHLT
jgi:hypothetical protein